MWQGSGNRHAELLIQRITVGPAEENYSPVMMRTNRGDIACRYYTAPGTYQAILWVGGVGGGFDSPARGLYPRLAVDLLHEGIASLRVRYRNPTDLNEAVLDVLAGLTYLEGDGMRTIGLVGHSFGGAVVLQAAAISQLARTVVTLATQSYGANAASELPAHCSLLLLHGTHDDVLPPTCSEYIAALAHEPKHLILYQGATHNLDEASDAVYEVVRAWMITRLNAEISAV